MPRRVTPPMKLWMIALSFPFVLVVVVAIHSLPDWAACGPALHREAGEPSSRPSSRWTRSERPPASR
eukprot:1806119-Pyramimonas_sp.AAC.1